MGVLLCVFQIHPVAGRKKQIRKALPKVELFFALPLVELIFVHCQTIPNVRYTSRCGIHHSVISMLQKKEKNRIGPVISKSKKHSLNPIPSTIIILVIHFHPICSEHISPAHTSHSFVRPFVQEGRLVGYAYTMISSHPLLSNGILQAYI